MAIAQMLLTSSGQEWQFLFLLTSRGKEWLFHIATDNLWSRMAIKYYYPHLLIKNANLTLLLTSSGQELLLTSIDQELQFHTAPDI